MVHELDQWLIEFENGKLDRRGLLSKILVTLGGAIGVGVTNNAVADETKTPTFPPNGLNHIALNVTDLARSRDWYCKHLGLNILRDGTHNCFMKTGDDFVALFKSSKPGLNHFCFTWPGKTANEAVRRLESAGMQPRREENRVYFKDPDGITVQVADENDWNDWR